MKAIRWHMIALVALGILVHAFYFGKPATTVFDEVHFGKFISAYFTHEYYFDIHPPLGKLILAGWGKLWHFQPGFSFANIGDMYPDKAYLALRFLPSLAGALLPLVIYLLALQLGLTPVTAFGAGILVALDNALLVQSRLILLDSFLLLFGFGAILAYATWRNHIEPRSHMWLLVLAGILSGLAISIKWTGASFLGLIMLMELIDVWRNRHETVRQRLMWIVSSLGIAPLVIYFLVFVIHFSLLGKSGTGDAFMSQRFHSGLTGSIVTTTENPMNIFQKTFELNREMYRANQRLTASHPYSSPWYSWPFMDRPIFYWVQGEARFYLLGNPIIWWFSTAAVFTCLAIAVVSLGRIAPPLAIMLVGWASNLLPFVGITRVMFLYHYFTALIWAILMLMWLVNRDKHRIRITLAIALLTLMAFIYFAPLSYGIPLSNQHYEQRVWFSHWR
jgi:dolichyl-phosphate-mannose-protein mannosyltransferase